MKSTVASPDIWKSSQSMAILLHFSLIWNTEVNFFVCQQQNLVLACLQIFCCLFESLWFYTLSLKLKTHLQYVNSRQCSRDLNRLFELHGIPDSLEVTRLPFFKVFDCLRFHFFPFSGVRRNAPLCTFVNWQSEDSGTQIFTHLFSLL